jgi:poly(beta-D-mannuronate) lyase
LITAGSDAPPYYHYEVAENGIVAHNTIIDSGSGILIGQGNNGVSPRNIKISGNMFYKINGSCVREKRAGANINFSDNLCNAAANSTNRSGFSNFDPRLGKDANSIYRPASNSPIINAVKKSVVSGMKDMDGQSRSSPYDLGADEFVQGKTGRGPISMCEVGPTTYNNGSSCSQKRPPKVPTKLTIS